MNKVQFILSHGGIFINQFGKYNWVFWKTQRKTFIVDTELT